VEDTDAFVDSFNTCVSASTHIRSDNILSVLFPAERRHSLTPSYHTTPQGIDGTDVKYIGMHPSVDMSRYTLASVESNEFKEGMLDSQCESQVFDILLRRSVENEIVNVNEAFERVRRVAREEYERIEYEVKLEIANEERLADQKKQHFESQRHNGVDIVQLDDIKYFEGIHPSPVNWMSKLCSIWGINSAHNNNCDNITCNYVLDISKFCGTFSSWIRSSCVVLCGRSRAKPWMYFFVVILGVCTMSMLSRYIKYSQ